MNILSYLTSNSYRKHYWMRRELRELRKSPLWYEIHKRRCGGDLNLKGYRKCPQCGSVRVCWNWVHVPLEKMIELNPHLSREELENSQWTHECWDCGDDIGGHCFETRDEVLDGIPYKELRA